MSGIAAILERAGERPVSAAAMQALLQIMRHRARDGAAQWSAREVALGLAQLHTTLFEPEEPCLEDDMAISADVRLDNRDDLVEALGLSNRTLSDSRLVLAAYRRWGEDCPNHLLGDFAFVIWDGKRKLAFCARDHFGVKPIYYLLNEERLVVASEAKAILGSTNLSPRLDERHIAAILAGFVDETDATHYLGINRLPPAHALAVTADKIRLWRYWDLEPVSPPSGQDHADRFLELFDAAVAARMRGTKAIGAMLSGGLDSSSIAMIAGRRHLASCGRKLTTFSLAFDQASGMDERPFIDAVLAKGHFGPAFVPVRDHAPFAGFETMLREQEGIFLATGLSVSRQLYALAADKGLRVLLDGHGGDEVVSHGYGFLQELAKSGRWIALRRELRAYADTYGDDRDRLFLTFFNNYGPGRHLQPLLRMAHRARSRLIPSQSVTPHSPAWRRFVNPDFASRTDLSERIGKHTRQSREASLSEATHHRWLISSPGIAHSFEVLDKAAAATGIEPRYPFWDKRLVEFCVGLPASEKLSDGWSRHVLRRAMDEILPAEVQWRRDKVDFKANLVRGLLHHHRSLLDSVLVRDVDGIAGYVNLRELREACERMMSSPAAARGDEVQFIWRTISLALWLRAGRQSDMAA
ncbi:asparagine synthase-related protein [Mesorhizobium sp. 1B3]|uniref:asparagine synthase-related protein n=1 Tax=Mesorhizobium sp. 1B3 TaxID=3243599 RepID=UPI003D96DC99